MCVFLMKCKISFKIKSFITMTIFKWLFAIVCSLMICKFTFKIKSFYHNNHTFMASPHYVVSDDIGDYFYKKDFYLKKKDLIL